jgi:hypothetical protein
MTRMQSDGIPLSYAKKLVEPEFRRYLERYVAFCYLDSAITEDEIALFNKVIRAFGIYENVAREYRERLAHGLRITQVRRGNLPRFRPTDVYLDSDETCHLDVPATYERELRSNVTYIEGRILVTNRKFRFVTSESLVLFATQQRGSGAYLVTDPEYCSTVADIVARIAKREVVPSSATRDTRRISQDMRAAVWNRDGGKCQECGSAHYLEFDHIIPLSKGGATSTANLQILCRACNLRKRDRI